MTAVDGARREPAAALEASIRRVRGEPLTGILVAASTAAVLGLVTAAVMPRGPATSLHGLLVIGSGLMVGTVAGVCSTSRWAGVAAILGYGLAFEIDEPAPSVPPSMASAWTMRMGSSRSRWVGDSTC